MFSKFVKKVESPLELEISNVVEKMSNMDPESEDYGKAADSLVKLMTAKSKDAHCRISADTAIMVAGNLLGIAIIIGHEKAHVITSKALGFVIKGRV